LSYARLAWSADGHRLVFMNADRTGEGGTGEGATSLVSVDVTTGDAIVIADAVRSFDLGR
jgi:dipeptidyl aminopeptidase/acylaminoacyl peptidase